MAVPTGDHDDAPRQRRPRPLRPGCRSRSARAPAEPRHRRRSPRLRLGDREHDPEQRHADPVVEAALDVQSLPDPARKPRQRHDRLAERRIGGRQDHREEECLRPRRARGSPRARGRSPPRASGVARSRAAAVAPRAPRARTSIRDASANRTSASVASASSLTVSPAGATLDQPQRVRADEQADAGEDHRGRDRRT